MYLTKIPLLRGEFDSSISVIICFVSLNFISYLYLSLTLYLIYCTLLHTCEYVFIYLLSTIILSLFSLFHILFYFFEDISIIGCYL